MHPIIDLTTYHSPSTPHTYFGLHPPIITSLLPRHGGVRADEISLCPHGSGTHSEGIGHVDFDTDLVTVFADKKLALPMPAMMVRVTPQTIQSVDGREGYVNSVPQPNVDEWIISRAELQLAWKRASVAATATNCLIVLAGHDQTNDAIFFTDEAMQWIRKEQNIMYLFTDQYSIDRKVCGRNMPNHRAFFYEDDDVTARNGALITECIWNPPQLNEGPYWLCLQLSPICGTDAVPSRVFVFERQQHAQL